MNHDNLINKVCLLTILFTLMGIELKADKGKWVPVRRADWTFHMQQVIFWDDRHGFIKGSHDELLITENGGETWSLYPWPDSVIDVVPGFWEDIQLTPDKDIWLVGSDGATVRIPYDGSQWELHVLPDRTLLRGVHFIDRNRGWLAGYYGEIIRTIDGGYNWEQIYNFEVLLWDICFLDSLHGFVLLRTGMDLSRCYKTADGGYSWTIIREPDVHGRTMYFLDQQHGWILGEYHDVFLTTDSGLTWKTVMANAGTHRLNSIYFLTPKKGWICGSSGLILKTEDGGYTWNRITSPSRNGIYDIFFIDENQGWAGVQYGIIAATKDGGNSWDWQIEAPNNTLNSVFFINKDNGFAIGNNIFIHTRNAGASWEQTDSLSGHAIQFVNHQHGWVTSVQHLYNTSNGGESWQKQHTFGKHTLLDINFFDRLHGWTLATTSEKATIHRTQDGGNTWQELPALPYDLYAIDFVSATQGWIVGGSGRILHTQDAGLNWELQREVQSVLFNALNDVDFVDTDYGWVVGFHGQIWHTKDGGQNWIEQQRTNNLDDQYYSVQFLDRKEGWIVGLIGFILHTTDGGETWDDSYSQYMGYWWSDVHFTDPEHGWVVGLYGAVDKFLGPNALSVPPVFQRTPETYFLHPNYPNPMQNITNIMYDVPYQAPVRVEIYDILGRQVCTLEQAVKSAGRYTVSWDGLDEDGHAVANGIYLYHIRIGKKSMTKKLMLVR